MGSVLLRSAFSLVVLASSSLSALAENGHQWTIKGSYAIVPTQPLQIGNQRQLLLDNYVVEDLRACRRKVHQPTKHPSNPLFSTGPEGLNPDSTAPYISVIRDHDTGLYRLWAASNILVRQPTPPGFYWLSRGRYFESSDGLQWRAPSLGLVESDGSKTNNIFMGGPKFTYDSLGVSPSPEKWRQRGRYLMIYNRGPAGRDPHPELIAGGQELRLPALHPKELGDVSGRASVSPAPQWESVWEVALTASSPSKYLPVPGRRRFAGGFEL